MEIGAESAWWIGQLMMGASADPQELARILKVPPAFVEQCIALARARVTS